jgi:hypothetical protein
MTAENHNLQQANETKRNEGDKINHPRGGTSLPGHRKKHLYENKVEKTKSVRHSSELREVDAKRGCGMEVPRTTATANMSGALRALPKTLTWMTSLQHHERSNHPGSAACPARTGSGCQGPSQRSKR